MKKVTIFICMILIICMTFSVSFAYANENSEALQTYEDRFTLEEKEYRIVVVESAIYNNGKLFDENGTLVEEFQYNKINEEMLDLLSSKKMGTVKKEEVSYSAIVDAEGYMYNGSYTYNLGTISSAAGLILALTTAVTSIPVSVAVSLVGEIGSFSSGSFDAETKIWRKIDSKYEYVKRYVSLYENISGNYKKVAGPEKYIQKRQ